MSWHVPEVYTGLCERPAGRRILKDFYCTSPVVWVASIARPDLQAHKKQQLRLSYDLLAISCRNAASCLVRTLPTLNTNINHSADRFGRPSAAVLLLTLLPACCVPSIRKHGT